MNNNTEDIIRNIELFKYMGEKEISILLNTGIVKQLKKNEIIFNEKDKSDFFYVIKKGKVEVFLERGENTITITHLSTGSFFGEIGFFTSSLRSASIRTEEPTELIVYEKENLIPLLEQNKNIGYLFLKALIESLAKRIVVSNENLETLFFINRALVDNEKFRNLFIAYSKSK